MIVRIWYLKKTGWVGWIFYSLHENQWVGWNFFIRYIKKAVRVDYFHLVHNKQ